jgi:hypothetical protein
MKFTTCKRLLFLSIPLGLLSGCGQSSKSSVSTVFSTSEAISTVSEITTDEKNIATRICYAYESKGNNFFSSPYIGGKFSYTIQNNDCNTTSNYSVVATLVNLGSGVLRFSPINTSQKFNNIVQTNNTGYLSQVCSNIKNNITISNTSDMGSVVVQIHFFKDSLDSYILKYFQKSSNNTYKITSQEIYKVRTQFNFTSGQVLGMDETYISQGTCTNNTTANYSFTQNFTNFMRN